MTNIFFKAMSLVLILFIKTVTTQPWHWQCFMGPTLIFLPIGIQVRKKIQKLSPPGIMWLCMSLEKFNSMTIQVGLKQHLTLLSDTHEKKIKESWHISDAPDDYIEKMIRAIVGVEIEISEMTGNTKMSQNHPDENRAGVVKGLKAIGNKDVANWVENPNRYND